MKICILSPRFPWPEIGGDYIRINRVAQYLKSAGHTVVLVAFYDDCNDTSFIKNYYDKIYLVKRKKIYSLLYSFLSLLKRKPIQCGYYYSPEYRRAFKEVVKKESPDRYICWLSRMSKYVEDLGLCDKTILEMSDALSKTYTLSSDSSAAYLKKLIYNIERKPIYNEEQKAIRLYPKVVLVAQPDIDYLQKEAGENIKSLALHTIGVDVYDNKSIVDPRKICFVGNMRTLQNQDAALRFVNNIFPEILKKVPDARFYIVGAEPSERIKGLANNKNIFVTGFVDNVQDFIADSCLSVAPVHVAAGIQNKVLMAMGCGIPVVMTSLISKAIPELKTGDNCYICDDNNDFANQCIQILQNPELRLSISKKCRDLVLDNYSWAKKLSGYECL